MKELLIVILVCLVVAGLLWMNKRLRENIRNIFKIEELRNRILYTLLIILIYRFGSYVVLPGVDPNMLAELKNQSSTGLLGLLNMFSGGAFANASVFALGIMPYITASIIIQLLGMAIPYFQRLQKEGAVSYTHLTLPTILLV